MGHYYHYPNEDAILYFTREIWPRVLREQPDAMLDIVGSCPTPSVLSLEDAQVKVSGTVPDVRPYLRRGAVFVAPLRLGEGIKGKLLEAFAMGIPVVSTTRVARAIGAEPGRHLLTADAPASFARQAVRLMRDYRLGRRLAREARLFAESRYGWSDLANRWIALCRELSGSPLAAAGSN